MPRLKRKLKLTKAKVIWFKPHLTTREAIKRMHGWNLTAAYRHLGRRGLPVGRRPKYL